MNSPRKQFNADESRFQGAYQQSLRNTMYQAYRPALPRLILFLVVGFIGRAALLGNANLIGYWVDSLCHTGPNCQPLPAFFQGFHTREFVITLAIANAAGFALTLLFRVGLSRLSAEAVSRIYDETTMRTSRMSMRFFDENPSGRIITRFTSDYNSIFRIFGGPIAEFLGLIFDFLSMTLLISIASPWLLPFWLLQAALSYGAYRYFLPALRQARREVSRKRSPAIAHFAETAVGANTIRAFQRESVFERRFSHLNDSYLEERERTIRIFARFSFTMGACSAFAFLVTGLAGLWMVRHGMLGVGAVGVAFAYFGLSTVVLQAFFDWLGQFEEALSGLERMNEYLRLPLEHGAKLPLGSSFQTGHAKETKKNAPLLVLGPHTGVSVEIKDLWLRYRPELPPVLQGVSVQIRAGERLAVVGKTGSGKTSLVQALFHLYPVERGSIHVGGFEADLKQNGAAENQVDLAAYRNLLAYITQEPTLFLGTLRENLIAPGASAATPGNRDEELIDALQRVQFLKEGATKEEYRYWLEYQVEERGRNLSSGERQLLCMARCLLQNAPVVILDEATSAVDPHSEEILMRATDEFFSGKTQIIIAHRLSTVRSCDKVLWLQNGKVHRVGAPGEVLPEFERAELST